MPPAMTPRVWLRPATWLAPGIALAFAAVLLWRFGGLALLGYDSYPLIASSRVESLGDFAGNFTERLMDGRYAGRFYRPVLNLTFAWDYSVWGLKPFGYHLTGVAIFFAGLLAICALMRRLLGTSAYGGALAAMLILALHPFVVEVLPVPARRPEMLVSLFMALALWAELAPRRPGARYPRLLPALFSFVAMNSKETGLLAPALVAVVLMLYLPRAPGKPWLGRFALRLAPHALALGAAIAMRVAVLGDLGGHTEPETDSGLGESWSVLVWVTGRLLAPQAVMSATVVNCLAGGLLAALAAAGVIAVTSPRAASSSATELDHEDLLTPAGPWRTMVVGLAWMVCVAVAVSMSGRREVWYLLPPAFGYAILGGAAWAALAGLARRQVGAPRVVGVAGCALLVALTAWQAWYSPVVRDYPQLAAGSAAHRDFLARLQPLIEATSPGRAVNAPPLPAWVEPDPSRPTVHGAALLWRYSIEAWAELVMPGRKVSVSGPGASPVPDGVMVRLTTALPGFAPPS